MSHCALHAARNMPCPTPQATATRCTQAQRRRMELWQELAAGKRRSAANPPAGTLPPVTGAKGTAALWQRAVRASADLPRRRSGTGEAAGTGAALGTAGGAPLRAPHPPDAGPVAEGVEWGNGSDDSGRSSGDESGMCWSSCVCALVPAHTAPTVSQHQGALCCCLLVGMQELGLTSLPITDHPQMYHLMTPQSANTQSRQLRSASCSRQPPRSPSRSLPSLALAWHQGQRRKVRAAGPQAHTCSPVMDEHHTPLDKPFTPALHMQVPLPVGSTSTNQRRASTGARWTCSGCFTRCC